MNVTRLFAIVSVCFLISATASAQVIDFDTGVFGPGPSASSLFIDVFDLPEDDGTLPLTLGPQRQLNIAAGGFLVDDFLVDEGEVNISGGSVGDRFNAYEGSEVNINAGSIGDNFTVGSERERIFDVYALVNIRGGSVGNNFVVLFGNEVNIYGGSVGDGFRAFDGSRVNLFGSDFALDGVPLDLISGDTFTILDRNVTLSGTLSDGSEFSFDLDTDFIQSGVRMTVTPDLLLGDVNQDGIVNFSDISPFIAILFARDFLAEADLNQDGVVNFSDISDFIVYLAS